MNILFLGDSLIEYFDWQKHFKEHRVANLGVAGESVQGLLSRVVRLKEAYADADLIFIMSGINNVAMGDIEFLDFYSVILEKLKSAYPKAKIAVNSLLPTIVEFVSNETIRNVNESLKALADKTNANYVDVYKRFIDTKGRPIKEYLLDDGVHLSRHGYDVWSNMIEGIIKGEVF